MNFAPIRRMTVAVLVSGFVLALAALSAAAEEKFDIRPQVRDGQSLGFDWTVGYTTTINANGNKQEASGELRIVGSLTYQKTENGQPTAAEMTIGKESAITQVQNGQRGNTPFPLAGKTVSMKRGEGGQVTVTGADDADAGTVEGLKKLLKIDTTMYPPGPVSVGDEWNVDPTKLPPEMTMNGQVKLEVKCKLLKLGEIRGRKSYDVAVSGSAKAQDGSPGTMVFGGVLQIDAATSLPAQMDMVMKASSEGFESQIKSSQSYTFAAAGAAPAAAAGGPFGLPPAVPPPAAKPPENPLDPGRPANPLLPPPARPPVAASPFNGAFKGEALAGEFNVVGDQVTGAVTLNDKKYPVVGVVKDGKITGTFEASGAKFNFTATIDGESMSFETEGTKYAMKKQAAANPLGRPRNPLDP